MPKTAQPKFVKAVKAAKKVPLPARTFLDSEFVRVLIARKTHRRFSKQKLPLETVSQLLYLVWGVTGYRYSPRFGKLFHKTSPSGGARHPGEVYLMALRVKGLRGGTVSLSARDSPAGDDQHKYVAREGMAVLRPPTFR